jgi:uncharacterized membrane protein YhfC
LFFGFFLYLVIKKKRTVVPILVGAAVFVLFQLIIRIPLLGVLSGMVWYQVMAAQPWLYGAFLGLTAGIFEEMGRFAGMTLLRKNRRWIDGLAFGVGHGGIEAVVLVGLTNVNNLILAVMINNGSFKMLRPALGAQADVALSQLTSAAPHDILIGGGERIFAFAIQIALSILVLYAIHRRRYILIPAAILLHMLVDAPIVILPQVFGWSIYGVELFLAAMAVIAVVFIVLSRRLWQDEPGDITQSIT